MISDVSRGMPKVYSGWVRVRLWSRLVSYGRRRVRGDRYPAEFARIQPVQLTVFATVDDNVPGPAVDVAEHRLSAVGAVEQPIARILPAGQGYSKRTLFAGANGVDHRRESIHVDQHAVAVWTCEQRMALQPTGREWMGTGRAPLCGLIQQFQVLDDSRCFSLPAAVVAHEEALVSIEPYRCSAVVAFGHDLVIGKGDYRR